MIRLSALAALALALVALTRGGSPLVNVHAPREGSEVVVTLAAPPLAESGRGGRARLDVEQNEFRHALASRLPEARIRWHYRLVLDGFSVVLPRGQIAELRRLPEVRQVYSSGGPYAPLDSQGPAQIGAPPIWGPSLETAGQGVKIGIIDTGLDASHPYFNPAGYTMPPGFPKGQRAYTTAKVIVARAFPPPGLTSKVARAPYDPQESSHGTHVAGIAAGNAYTKANGAVISGVAPRAYIGNYKALTRTQFGESPNGNAPELVAAIEAAVADGMDVINLSVGEFEIDPNRDIVAKALDAAAAAGVVPVVAAGNGYDSEGAGSIWSPGTSAQAITVGAVETDGAPPASTHAYFSSVGPTPLSLRLKPDVVAPGVDIVSSLPGGWGTLSGSSMAAPHVAGAAALLRQRHPDWSVAQIKSAIVETATPARRTDGSTALAGPTFVGGGVVDVAAADRPLVFTDPSDVSLGYVSRGSGLQGTLKLEDAGDGAGTWQVSLDRPTAPSGVQVIVPTSVEVPGDLEYKVVAAGSAAEGDVSGYIELTRGTEVRRIPFWGRLTAPRLGDHSVRTLTHPGLYTASTRGQPALVSRYRYPDDPVGYGVDPNLGGPELVYRVNIPRGSANFGVVITKEARGAHVEPRVVAGLDENRLTGEFALPFVANPYLDAGGSRVLAAGAVAPTAGQYAVVFDSPTTAGAGRFTFRFWINDVTPPSVRLQAASVVRDRPIRLAVADRGSGVYARSLDARIDGSSVQATIDSGVVRIPTGALTLGRHRLRVQISDYQETKNNENVGPILPNTRVLRAVVTIRAR